MDPTTIPVSSSLVGIVGPNGCGKSNVIDAVRWVLGESKASALRGDSIQDVIFAGSNNRKAIGRASVEIIFDNELKKLPGNGAISPKFPLNACCNAMVSPVITLTIFK